MSDNEMSLIGDLVRHLPVFRNFDINNLPDVARECTAYLSAENGMRRTLHLIAESVPARLRETAYAIACDVAAADGSVSNEEARLLELLRGELSIDRLHAAAIERGARARYLVG
jgi:tellurite resistance protein